MKPLIIVDAEPFSLPRICRGQDGCLFTSWVKRLPLPWGMFGQSRRGPADALAGVSGLQVTSALPA